jgi:hypothetical protein
MLTRTGSIDWSHHRKLTLASARPMGGNSDSDEFEDDDGEEISAGEDLDLDRAMKDMEIGKRRAAKAGEPAWRRLEQRAEQKLTAELISDFEDYNIGEEPVRRGRSAPKRRD